MRLKVHPSVKHGRSILANVRQKTQLSLAEWKDVVFHEGLTEVAATRDWLKSEFEVGRVTAEVIAKYVLDENPNEFDEGQYLADAPKLVEAQYYGKRACLRPILDVLTEYADGLGDDVGASPCKTFVPLYRNHVFAQIKPAGLKRIDLGLALGKHEGELPDLLIDTGGKAKGDRITHRIALTTVEDVTNDAKLWLTRAYDLDEN